jgi:AcrR family transcriptional regulator
MAKGENTKNNILVKALDEVSIFGLEALTIGKLAAKLNLSKSGLFAHFGSKEKLQIEILKHNNFQFKKKVLGPAFKEPRGIRRIECLFELWNQYTLELSGGCIWVSLTSELDDQPGLARDLLVKSMDIVNRFIIKFAEQAKDLGEFNKNLDTQQFAQEFWGIHLSHHQNQRLFGDPQAANRALITFQNLLKNSKN